MRKKITDIKAYMREYNKTYKRKKRSPTLGDILPDIHVYRNEGPKICALFGCAQALTLLETMAGKYCIHHQGGPAKLDPTNFISY